MHTGIIIPDTGPGTMDTACRQNFEPLYTTTEGGTGYDLATARRQVTDAAAIARVTNGRRGTASPIRLPVPRNVSTQE